MKRKVKKVVDAESESEDEGSSVDVVGSGDDSDDGEVSEKPQKKKSRKGLDDSSTDETVASLTTGLDVSPSDDRVKTAPAAMPAMPSTAEKPQGPAPQPEEAPGVLFSLPVTTQPAPNRDPPALSSDGTTPAAPITVDQPAGATPVTTTTETAQEASDHGQHSKTMASAKDLIACKKGTDLSIFYHSLTLFLFLQQCLRSLWVCL